MFATAAFAMGMVVMFDGKIMGVVPADQASKEELGLMMAGVGLDELVEAEPAAAGV